MIEPRFRYSRPLLLVASLQFALGLAAVGCDNEEPIVQEDPAPIVAPMATPISLRQDPGIPDGISIEIGTDRVRVNGTTVQKLQAGRLVDKAAAKIEPGAAPLIGLAAAVKGAPGTAKLSVHVNTPYTTLLEAIETLKKAGVRKFAFQVRAPGETTTLGWMVLDKVGIQDAAAAATDEAVIETAHPNAPEWNAFVKNWEAVNTACRSNHYVDCDARQEHVAENGKVRIGLLARGRALQVEFERYGAPKDVAAPAGGGGEMLEGLGGGPSGEPVIKKVDRAVFTWRFAAATESPSPISQAFAPLCKSRSCPVELTADEKTPAMRLISFLGAAFPSSSEAPDLVLVRPASS